METKIYAVWKREAYESGDVVSIFDNEEMAKNERAALQKELGYGHEVQYDEYILNKSAL